MDILSTLQALVKPVVVLAYIAFGLFLLISAAGRRLHIPTLPAKAKLLVGGAVGILWIWSALHGFLYIVSVPLGIAVFAATDDAWRSRSLMLSGSVVVILSASLAWWVTDTPQPVVWWQPLAFAGAVWGIQAGLLRGEEGPQRSRRPLLVFLFVAGGFALLANVAQYEPGSTALALLVHHQGAYIGPALHIRAGLVPFYDIPLQYGLGPTLSIAAVCGASGCWSGLAFLMISSSLIMGFLILRMALETRMPHGMAWRATATAVVFTAVFLWPGLPSLGSIVSAFPSVGGLRFLPVALVAFLLFFERPGLAALVLAPAVLWSPETGVMSLAVFGVHETARLGFAKAAIRTAAIVGASFTVLVVVHHGIYGLWLQPDVFAEYVLHVPTPYPINPIGDFLFMVAALGLAAWNVYRPPLDQLSFRRDLVISSLLFGSMSYYLGRSHPNNICNLMPFMVLVMLRSLDGPVPAMLPKLPRLAILGISASTAALTLSPWYIPPFQHGFSADIQHLAAAAALTDADMIAVRSRIANPEHLGIADLGHLNRNPLETAVWTAMDPCALWTSVPHNRRQLYIRRSAARLRQSGWIILADDQRDWLNDFRVAYSITEETSYRITSPASHQPETFLVAHLIPLDEVGKVVSK